MTGPPEGSASSWGRNRKEKERRSVGAAKADVVLLGSSTKGRPIFWPGKDQQEGGAHIGVGKHRGGSARLVGRQWGGV